MVKPGWFLGNGQWGLVPWGDLVVENCFVLLLVENRLYHFLHRIWQKPFTPILGHENTATEKYYSRCMLLCTRHLNTLTGNV